MTKLLTLAEAAKLAGMPPSSLRSWATRLRQRKTNPIELWAPREKWVDGRTPVVEQEWLEAVLKLRPGRGGSWDDTDVPTHDTQPQPAAAQGAVGDGTETDTGSEGQYGKA